MNRRHQHQRRISRTLLTITGIVLIAIAAAGALLAATKIRHLGDLDARTSLLNGTGREFLNHHQLPLQLTGVAIGVGLILVGAIWLKNQIPPIPQQRDRHISHPDAEPDGSTTIRGDALANALTAHLESHPTIQNARCELRTDEDLILIRLDIPDTAPIDPILQHVHSSVDRLIRVAELTTEPTVETTLRPTGTPARRVD